TYQTATWANGTARGPSRPRQTRNARPSQESPLLTATVVFDMRFTTMDRAPPPPVFSAYGVGLCPRRAGCYADFFNSDAAADVRHGSGRFPSRAGSRTRPPRSQLS